MPDAPRVLIFDFDGVIVESNAIKTAAFAHVFARFPEHYDAMMDFHREQVSASRFVKFDHLVSLLGARADAGLKAELADAFSSFVAARVIDTPAVPGAEELLGSLDGKLPLYLASVTPEAELGMILEKRGLSAFFRGVYGCPPWTKPEALRDVLHKEGIEPHQAMLIGDSAGDQRAAGEVGVPFLARDSGLAFDPPQPAVFKDLHGIKAHLENMR